MHDIRLFAQHRENLYRVVQDDDGRIAYIPADKSEMRHGDLLSKIPDSAFMCGIHGAGQAPCRSQIGPILVGHLALEVQLERPIVFMVSRHRYD